MRSRPCDSRRDSPDIRTGKPEQAEEKRGAQPQMLRRARERRRDLAESIYISNQPDGGGDSIDVPERDLAPTDEKRAGRDGCDLNVPPGYIPAGGTTLGSPSPLVYTC
ncbi:hypothetical protein VTK56DRAFT_6479 [Thermocarpiscus australiensis]